MFLSRADLQVRRIGLSEQASVRRWVRRNVAGTALFKASSQLGDYLGAKDFYLLEDYFLR